MNQDTNPVVPGTARYLFKLPQEFIMATRKFIIIRECYATVMNPHKPENQEVGNICLHASFVWEYPSQYCCLVNSQSMKKKCFEFLGSSTDFVIQFRTLDGAIVQPESYLFDFVLKYQ
jgi:hypothetical protein